MAVKTSIGWRNLLDFYYTFKKAIYLILNIENYKKAWCIYFKIEVAEVRNVWTGKDSKMAILFTKEGYYDNKVNRKILEKSFFNQIIMFFL